MKIRSYDEYLFNSNTTMLISEHRIGYHKLKRKKFKNGDDDYQTFMKIFVSGKLSIIYCIKIYYFHTCRPLNSIWKFLALSWVTLPPKSSWYTWLDSFHIGALLCITSSLLTASDLWLDIPAPFCFNYRCNWNRINVCND